MEDVPDIYADDVMVNLSTHGMTLTLIRSRPEPNVPLSKIAKPVVGRVRLNHTLAASVADVITSALAQFQTGDTGADSVKH